MRQPLEQRLARRCRRDVAAVQQQVGILGERRAPAGEPVGGGLERRDVQRPAGELEGPRLAVAEQMDRGDFRMPPQDVLDLGETVAFAVEHHDAQRVIRMAGSDRVDQRDGIGHRRIDEYPLLARRRGGVRRHRVDRAHLGWRRGGGLRRRDGRCEHRARMVGRVQHPLLDLFGDRPHPAGRHRGAAAHAL